MSSVAADMIGGHDRTDDDAEDSEEEKSNGKADLLDWCFVARRVRRLHHHVIVSDRECVIYVHFVMISIWLCLLLVLQFQFKIDVESSAD